MLTTVVIPARNAQSFLRDALKSVSEQSRRVEHVVVVDDGSEDDTIAVARRAAFDFDLPLSVVRSDGTGPAAARNRGLAIAQTDAIVFLDADDFLPRTAVREQTERLEVGSVAFGYQRKFRGSGIPPQTNGAVEAGDSYLLAPGGCAAHRSVFDQCGPFVVAGPLSETILWFEELRRSDTTIHRVERVVRLRRIHDANLSSLTSTTHRGYAEGLKMVLDARRARTAGGAS